MRELKRTYYYFTGKGQFAPKWARILPGWFLPAYLGDGDESHTWRWFGIKIKTACSQTGDTLFMYWRRQIKQGLQRWGK